ncbi:Mu transposase C-terminal domain-containing protein [Bacillus paramycoides]|uniref:Mu transposase C-terminal domain-containing protein n=1 Tax=Bacillus paramycoides TaxID=2026194 RepID=UPI0037F31BB0
MKYPQDIGFHSLRFNETEWAVWDEFLFDNAKAHLSKIVTEKLTNVLGCAINTGPVKTPQRRGIIERFFRTLSENLYHRLPSTTGSNPNDPKRKHGEDLAIKYEMNYEELEELTEVCIANYNCTQHTTLYNASPIEALERQITNGSIIKTIPLNQRKEMVWFMQTVTRKVNGDVTKGVKCYINYEGVRYTNEVLARSMGLVGEVLTLQVDIEDLRCIKAFLPDGSELGLLQAKGKWALQKHSLKIRKAINSLINNKKIYVTLNDDPVDVYLDYLEQKAQNEKAARNKLVSQKRILQSEKQDGPYNPITNFDDNSLVTQEESNTFSQTALASNVQRYKKPQKIFNKTIIM